MAEASQMTNVLAEPLPQSQQHESIPDHPARRRLSQYERAAGTISISDFGG